MRGHPIHYSDDELAWIEEWQAWPRASLHSAFVALFKRKDVSLENFKSLCSRKGWKTGRTGCFRPGDVPANKGQLCPPGRGGRHPNSRATQFRKGSRTGAAEKKYKPIGAERLSKDGYLERKIHDGRPFQSRWRAVHLIEWEALHGPVPKGHCLKALDGDRRNTDPSNWELVARALLPRLNGGPQKTYLAYDQAAPEVRSTLLALARLDRKGHELRKGKRRA